MYMCCGKVLWHMHAGRPEPGTKLCARWEPVCVLWRRPQGARLNTPPASPEPCSAIIMLHRQRWAQDYEYAFFLALLSLCIVTVPALR